MNFSRALGFGAALALLSACGGGGGSGGVGDGTGGQPTSFAVSTSASGSGSISPASATVSQGRTTTFSVTANSGHVIDSVTGCNGTLTGTTFTTGAITAACAVNASFRPLTFTVSTSTDGTGSGTITPEAVTVNQGESTSFTIAPSAGSEIQSVTGCNGTLTGTTFTTGAITGSCSVTATFSTIRVTEFCVSNAEELQAALEQSGKSHGEDIIRLTANSFEGNFRLDIEAVSQVHIEGGFVSGCRTKDDSNLTILDGLRQGLTMVTIADQPSYLRIHDLSIINGRNARIDGSGAGLYIRGLQTDLHIGNLRVSGNDGSPYSVGGGLYIAVREAEIIDSEFVGNAAVRGAGAYLICQRCEVRGNSFSDNIGSDGGGLSVGTHRGVFLIEDNLFFRNVAEGGGGGGLNSYVPDGLVVRGNIFSMNQSFFGGGAWVFGGLQTVSSIESNTFENNKANGGGGLFVLSYGSSRVVNNVVALNEATDLGGGVYLRADYDVTKMIFANNTVVKNRAASGAGGINVKQQENGATVSLLNNAIFANDAPTSQDFYIDNDGNGDFTPSPTTVWNNALTNAGSFNVEIGQPVDLSNIFIDPLAFIDFDAGDYRPRAGSPLVNAGIANDDVPSIDITGFLRDGQPDIGAYEFRTD